MTKKSAGRRRHKLHDQHYDQFVEQLKAQGLVIQPIAADGDCMFAAIADQLNLIQNTKKYVKAEIREETVNYILKNSNELSAFLVDETVENYCCGMRKQGRWGGHIELQAAVHVYQCNIVIYQFDRARFILRHPDAGITDAIHLSYHDGEHYSSCRSISGHHQPLPQDLKPHQYKQIHDRSHYVQSNRDSVRDNSYASDDDDQDSIDAGSKVDKKSQKDGAGKKKEKGRRMTKKEIKLLKKQEKIRLKNGSDKNINGECQDKNISDIVQRLGTVLI